MFNRRRTLLALALCAVWMSAHGCSRSADEDDAVSAGASGPAVAAEPPPPLPLLELADVPDAPNDGLGELAAASGGLALRGRSHTDDTLAMSAQVEWPSATGRPQPSRATAASAANSPRQPHTTTAAPLGGRPSFGADPTRAAIDPNGRFATTYRPGRGHLAGFEASLARGELPAEARQLVGDVGSAYAPELATPSDHALAWRVDLERSALPPSGGHTHLRIALRSSATAATERPPMSVHVVFDVSSSMQGESIVHARRAAQALVERLEAGDHFSLVAFGGTASVRVPEGVVGPRRQQILDTIGDLQLEGGTNISAGLDLGYAEAARGPQRPEWVKLVMLISDGRPNTGDIDVQRLTARAARAFQSGVQTSAFGLGDDYDGVLMSGLAQQGAGGYYYVRDAQGIAQSLATELESRLQPVAQAVEVRVRLRPDVALTQTYGSHRLDAGESAAVRTQELAVDAQTEQRDRIARDRVQDAAGGMRFFIPGFARDDQHVILLGIHLPAGIGPRAIATVELRYKDRLTKRNVVDEQPVRAAYADSAAASAQSADRSVLRTVQGFDAGETLLRASRMIGAGDPTGAYAILGERAALLRAASRALAEPRLDADANRIDRLRNFAGAGDTMSAPLVLAMLLDTSGQRMLR